MRNGLTILVNIFSIHMTISYLIHWRKSQIQYLIYRVKNSKLKLKNFMKEAIQSHSHNSISNYNKTHHKIIPSKEMALQRYKTHKTHNKKSYMSRVRM